MRLTDLEPRWLTHNLFIFRCPHCRKKWLTCKNAFVSFRDQHNLFKKDFGDSWLAQVVGCNDTMIWTFSSQDFATITVTPSLDASGSGHWHGNIINGEISGGRLADAR
jgi:hypothetical protein